MNKTYWNCFGSYSSSHPICTQYCGVRLKCLAEKEYSLHTALLKEIVYWEDDQPKSTH